MKIQLSIIVPVYNREKTIKKCLESICVQKLENIEIIVVDDGSTDETAKIIKGVQELNSEIKYYYINNSGAFNARKYGVKKAIGKYITFVDSDDWIEDDIYLDFSAPMGENVDFISYGLIFNKYIDRPYDGNTLLNSIDEGYYYSNNSFIDKMIFDVSYRKAGINQSLCTKIIKREIIQEAMNYVTRKLTFGDDAVVVFAAALKANSFYFSNNHKYHYVIQNESITSNISSDTFNCILNLKKELEGLSKFINNKIDINKQILRYLQHIINISVSKMFDVQILQSCTYNIDFLRNKNILIYGAGEYGEKFYKTISSEPDIKTIGWIDALKSGKVIRNIKIDSPDNINNYEFDYIVIAVKTEEFSNKIKNTLIENKVDESKIKWIKPEECLDTFYYNI